MSGYDEKYFDEDRFNYPEANSGDVIQFLLMEKFKYQANITKRIMITLLEVKL